MANLTTNSHDAIDIGSRLNVMVDEYLIERMSSGTSCPCMLMTEVVGHSVGRHHGSDATRSESTDLCRCRLL